MSNIGIVGSSDILFKKSQIRQIRESGVPLVSAPLNAVLGDKPVLDKGCLVDHLDGSVTEDEYYAYMRENDHDASRFPTTSQPSPGQFMTAIEEAFDGGATDVYVFPVLPSRSGTFQSALVAAAEISGVELPQIVGVNEEGYYTGDQIAIEFPWDGKSINP